MINENFVREITESFENWKTLEISSNIKPLEKSIRSQKLMWLTEDYFNLPTYDSNLSEEFGITIYEVIKAILDQKTFDYIKDDKKYRKYITVAILLDKLDLLNWGTSIRGAWFDGDENKDKMTKLISFIDSE